MPNTAAVNAYFLSFVVSETLLDYEDLIPLETVIQSVMSRIRIIISHIIILASFPSESPHLYK